VLQAAITPHAVKMLHFSHFRRPKSGQNGLSLLRKKTGHPQNIQQYVQIIFAPSLSKAKKILEEELFLLSGKAKDTPRRMSNKV
jgi:hypothetical protein